MTDWNDAQHWQGREEERAAEWNRLTQKEKAAHPLLALSPVLIRPMPSVSVKRADFEPVSERWVRPEKERIGSLDGGPAPAVPTDDDDDLSGLSAVRRRRLIDRAITARDILGDEWEAWLLTHEEITLGELETLVKIVSDHQRVR